MIALDKCSEENGDTCSGTKEEIDAYFDTLSIATFYNDNYLEYSDINNPFRAFFTGGFLKVASSLEFASYKIKLSKLESYNSYLLKNEATVSYFTDGFEKEELAGDVFNLEVFNSVGVPISNATTNLIGMRL